MFLQDRWKQAHSVCFEAFIISTVHWRISWSDLFEKPLDQKLKLGSTARGHVYMKFFGLSLFQHTDSSSTLDGDDKIYALEPFPLSRTSRRMKDYPMNAMEWSTFMSINSYFSWLGINSSPLCSFYSRYLQQQLPANTVTFLKLKVR